jgi:predicted TIM-barrel fold metal-dependent hydrolase
MKAKNPQLTDAHVHVGVLGNKWPQYGHLSEWYRQQITYKIFLLYAGIEEDKVSDTLLLDKTLKTINNSMMDKVVCLALDPVYTSDGKRSPEASNVWVDNEYIIKEVRPRSSKVLLGASVHPYDPDFNTRVKKYVDEGAVLLKWLPSAQQFDLADERVAKALEFLATVKGGKPLPLLLHIGPEYAIPSTDEKTFTYDFLSWSWIEKARNWLRFKNRWHTPQVKKIEENLMSGFEAGSVIIFAHCGLPYFASGILSFLEHSDLQAVKRFLKLNKKIPPPGRFFADVSAFSTPFRYEYFHDIVKLPSDYLIFGSDFPTPVFEIYADMKERISDLKAILNGHLERAFVPQDNLLDVNYKNLRQAFPGHPLFTNISKLI